MFFGLVTTGLSQIIPINMLVLLRWDELERLTCGNAVFDVVCSRFAPLLDC